MITVKAVNGPLRLLVGGQEIKAEKYDVFTDGSREVTLEIIDMKRQVIIVPAQTSFECLVGDLSLHSKSK